MFIFRYIDMDMDRDRNKICYLLVGFVLSLKGFLCCGFGWI